MVEEDMRELNNKRENMAELFYIDFRLHGYVNKYAKWARVCTLKKARENGVREMERRKYVPHMTLFGPAETYDLKKVTSEVEKICKKYTLVPFKINGFSCFKNADKDIIYFNIEASPDLEQLRNELAQNLIKISTKYTSWDANKKFSFHTTIGEFFTSDDSKFDSLYHEVENRCHLNNYKRYQSSIFVKFLNFIKALFVKPNKDNSRFGLYLLRVTILGKGSRILFEYDLILKKFLTRKEALSKHIWKNTLNKFRELRSQL